MINCQGVTFYDPTIKKERQLIENAMKFGVKFKGLGRTFVNQSIKGLGHIDTWIYNYKYQKYSQKFDDYLWRIHNDPNT